MHDGFVSLSSDMSYSTLVKILRDTGASKCLLLADGLSFSDNSSTDTRLLIQGVHFSSSTPVPLHSVYLSSDFASGHVMLCIRSVLHFDVVHLLLGTY